MRLRLNSCCFLFSLSDGSLYVAVTQLVVGVLVLLGSLANILLNFNRDKILQTYFFVVVIHIIHICSFPK
jgi:hypothetical protein